MKQIGLAVLLSVVSAGTAFAQFSDTAGKPVLGTWLMSASDPKAGYGPEVGFCVNRFIGPGVMLEPMKPKDGVGFLTGSMMGDPNTCKMSTKSKASCTNPANKDRWECTISPQEIASCTVHTADGKIKLTTTGPRYPGEC